MAANEYLTRVATELGSIVGEAAAQNFAVAVKTNIAPELTIYRPSSGPSLLEFLGIEYAIVVRDKQGRVVATYGEPPATDPVIAAAFAAVLVIGALAVVRVIRRG